MRQAIRLILTLKARQAPIVLQVRHLALLRFSKPASDFKSEYLNMPDPEVGRILNQFFGPNAADRSSDTSPPAPGQQGSPPQQVSEKPRSATRACERCRQMKVRS